jgi:hypothetical protein
MCDLEPTALNLLLRKERWAEVQHIRLAKECVAKTQPLDEISKMPV